MKNLLKALLPNWYWLLLLILVIIVVIIPKHTNIAVSKIDYKYKYDSLKIVLIQKDLELSESKHIRDSLINQKVIKNIYYDTQIKNFANSAIVSDDSITSFISKKIYNK